jgi:hypothetical protein
MCKTYGLYLVNFGDMNEGAIVSNPNIPKGGI